MNNSVITKEMLESKIESNQVQKVTIINFDMPFLSLVNFMAKVALASIPAALIVAIFAMAITGIISVIFHH